LDHSRDVAAWPRETGHIPQGNRVVVTGHHDDGDRVGGAPGGPQRSLGTRRNDHVNVETDQLSGEAWEPLELPLRGLDLERQVLAFHVPQLLQSLREAPEDQRGAAGTGEEDADPKDFPRQLRIGREQRHEEAEGERHEAPNGTIPHGGVLQHT
jgi:hypothetical protein